MNYETLTREMRRLAIEAGVKIMEIYDADRMDVEVKADDSPVTAADKEAQEYLAAEIAERSYLSINSVKTYIRTAYRKLGLSRRSQAVRWGLEHGFLPPEPRRTNTARGVAEVAAPRQ